jgi:uncharacterized Tic20 family protein
MLCHLSALLMLFFSWGAVLGPLIVWLIKRNESSVVDDQGKESLNFQITVYIICLALSIVLGLLMFGTVGFGALWGSPLIFTGGLAGGFGLVGILSIVRLIDIILVVVASIRANNGVSYRYPFNIRFIK